MNIATISIDVHNILDLFKQQLHESEKRILDAIQQNQIIKFSTSINRNLIVQLIVKMNKTKFIKFSIYILQQKKKKTFLKFLYDF